VSLVAVADPTFALDLLGAATTLVAGVAGLNE
jgi:hypothetical protein